MRLEGKTAIIMGAGQSPGQGVGNGRATALLFAREGARVLCVDRDLASAADTAELIASEGGEGGDLRGGRDPRGRGRGGGGGVHGALGPSRHPAQQRRDQRCGRRRGGHRDHGRSIRIA